MTSLDLRWKALASRASAADGTFIYAVSSTAIAEGQPRVGRKMGHITALGDSVDEAAAKALAARDVLC